MNPELWIIILSLGVFAGMVSCLEYGYRLGSRSLSTHGDPTHEGLGAIDAAVFGFLALLLAFSFSGATSRLDMRRGLIVDEANAIGTAYLRVDLLATAQQPEVRRLFREYVDTRLRVYEKMPDEQQVEQELTRAAQLQQTIWSRAVAGTGTDASGRGALLLLPAVNAMIDVTTARTIALHTHLPGLIFALLIIVALLSGLVAGYGLAKRRIRSWLYYVLYAGLVTVTIYVVLDLENPRIGLVRLDAADAALVQLRDSIR